jgi:hypothetical protein
MRGTPVFVGSGFVASYLQGGGSFWIPLQYLRGFRDHGFDCYWLEVLQGTSDHAADRKRIDAFFRQAARLWSGDRLVLLYLPQGAESEAAELLTRGAHDRVDLHDAIQAGVLLNFNNHVPRRHRQAFGRSVLYDIDPGMLQLWAQQTDMGIGDHDLHVTIGRAIGTPECHVPCGGIAWAHVWPAVHLPSWPMQENAGSRYTTVTHWWNGNRGYDLIDDELYEHNKRTAFMGCLDLPRRAALDLELAAYVTAAEVEDREALKTNGWRLADPTQVASTPWRYRFYIQGSRGEFSCAKPSVVKTSPGWISDRTICYLASGGPCIVQDAGAKRYLPVTLGLQFFTDVGEAAEALRAAELDHARARREARSLAEEVFSTRVVIPQLVSLIDIERPRQHVWQVRRTGRPVPAHDKTVEIETRQREAARLPKTSAAEVSGRARPPQAGWE